MASILSSVTAMAAILPTPNGTWKSGPIMGIRKGDYEFIVKSDRRHWVWAKWRFGISRPAARFCAQLRRKHFALGDRVLL